MTKLSNLTGEGLRTEVSQSTVPMPFVLRSFAKAEVASQDSTSNTVDSINDRINRCCKSFHSYVLFEATRLALQASEPER